MREIERERMGKREREKGRGRLREMGSTVERKSESV